MGFLTILQQTANLKLSGDIYFISLESMAPTSYEVELRDFTIILSIIFLVKRNSKTYCF